MNRKIIQELNNRKKSIIIFAAIFFLWFLNSCSRESNSCEFIEDINSFDIEINGNDLIITTKLSDNFTKSDVLSYGISYQIQGEIERLKVQYNNPPNSSQLRFRIEENLFCGESYNFHFYINLESETCRSKTFYFDAPISSEPTPWCYKQNELSRSEGYDIFGIAIEGRAFFLYQFGTFYEIDTSDLTISRKTDFPLDGDTGTHFTTFTFDNLAYAKSSESSDLFRFDSDTNLWMKYGKLELRTDLYSNYRAEIIGNTVYIFNRFFSYKYHVENKTLEFLSEYIVKEFISSFKANNDIYAIDEDFKISILNTNTGNWNELIEYPGNKSEDIITFVNEGKVYIGLSYSQFSPGKITYLDMYEFDISTFEWKRLKDFQRSINNSWNITSIPLNDRIFLAHQKTTGTLPYPVIIWKFDPAKIVYY